MIHRHFPALVLFLLAVGLYGGVALPARQGAARLEAELARLRAESEPLRRRAAEREPQRVAEEAWREAVPSSDQSVTGLRRVLLASVTGASVSRVRLSVAPASPPLAARTRFAALGSFSELVALSERLIGPRTGVVPDRLRFTIAGSELSFELDGVVLERTR
jgi:hypothetical protein